MQLLRHALVMIDPLITHPVRLSVCILIFVLLLLQSFPMCSKKFLKVDDDLRSFLTNYRPCCQAFEILISDFKGLQQGPQNPQNRTSKPPKNRAKNRGFLGPK
jgi:hypothetical protein